MAAASVWKRTDVVAVLNPQSSTLGCKTRNHNKAVWYLVLHPIRVEKDGRQGKLLIPISEIKIAPIFGEPIMKQVRLLATSISEYGLLNPIAVDSDYNLLSGLHRLEAVKLLGWSEIEGVVINLAGLQAELAEIDENVIQKSRSNVDFGDLLLRRKVIYEILHPETRNGGDRKSRVWFSIYGEGNPNRKRTKSFAQDTADKLGVSVSTVRRQIEVAKRLTPEVKSILRQSTVRVSKKNAMLMSRMKPDQQKAVALLLVMGNIQSVEEYLVSISSNSVGKAKGGTVCKSKSTKSK